MAYCWLPWVTLLPSGSRPGQKPRALVRQHPLDDKACCMHLLHQIEDQTDPSCDVNATPASGYDKLRLDRCHGRWPDGVPRCSKLPAARESDLWCHAVATSESTTRAHLLILSGISARDRQLWPGINNLEEVPSGKSLLNWWERWAPHLI